MEIPEPSSISQANARFSGLTNSQIQDCIARIYPFPQNEKIHSAKYVSQAISSTGAHKDFREKDYIEGHRMLQGVLTNPWISVADINHPDRTDISYMDSGYSDVKDLQTQMIGQLAGAPQLNDPRHVFVENLLKMKIHQKNPENNSYDYMKDLFLTQIDHGMSYYQNQAMAQKHKHDMDTSVKLQRIDPFDHSVTIRNATMGTMEVSHAKRPRDMVVRTSGVFSHNTKRAKLDELHARFASQIPVSEYDDYVDPLITPTPSVSTTQSEINRRLGGGGGGGAAGGAAGGGGGGGSGGGGGGGGSGSGSGGGSVSSNSSNSSASSFGLLGLYTPHKHPGGGQHQLHGGQGGSGHNSSNPASADALGLGNTTISPGNAPTTPNLGTIYPSAGSGSPSPQAAPHSGGFLSRLTQGLSDSSKKQAREIAALIYGNNPAAAPASATSIPTGNSQMPSRRSSRTSKPPDKYTPEAIEKRTRGLVKDGDRPTPIPIDIFDPNLTLSRKPVNLGNEKKKKSKKK